MRSPSVPEALAGAPVTTILIGLNILIFVAGIADRYLTGGFFFSALSLDRGHLLAGQWWRLLTHAFLHAGILHLAVNMAALWFTGPLVERVLGTVRYLLLFLAGAVAGGLLQTLTSPSDRDLVGASGAVCALLAGFATLFPRLRITALILFVIPIRMNASTLGWIIAVSSLAFWILGIEPEIGHLAHLGGAVAGCLLCLLFRNRVRDFLPGVPPPLPDRPEDFPGPPGNPPRGL
jgi:membrane associated rhomboid family serine protease